MTINFNNLRNTGNGYGAMPDLGFLSMPTGAPITATPMDTMPVMGMPMLNSIGPAPSFLEGIGADFKNWFNRTPVATTTNAQGIKTQGMFDMGLGAAQGLLGAYLGFQNLGLQKDILSNNKRQFDLNFAAQQKTTNARMADRQASRVAFGAGATPVDQYMAKNGI